jgi:phage protein U
MIKKDFIRIPKNSFPILPLLTWGDLVFKISTVAVEGISKGQDYDWVSIDRYGGRKLYQFVGIGEQQFTVSGVILPQFGYNIAGGFTADDLVRLPVGTKQLDDFYNIAATGAVRELIDGRGAYWGDFFIRNIQETNSQLSNTGVARRQEYQMTFVRHGQDSLGNTHVSYNKLLDSLIDSVTLEGGVIDLFN